MKLEIPETASEVKLSNSLDFNIKCIELYDWLIVNSEKVLEKDVEYIVLILQCLNTYYDGIVDFFDIDAKIIESVDHKEIQAHLEFISKNINKTQAHDTVIGIFNLIYKAITHAKPRLYEEDNTSVIIYKGKEFELPEVWKDKIYGSMNFKSVSVRQAIEVLNIQNQYNSIVSNLLNPKNEKGEPIEEGKINRSDPQFANVMFTKYLSELAILLIEKGHKIPNEESDFKRFLTTQMDFWQDIDLQTAIDIEYWFDKYYESLKEDKENYYYFNNKSPESMEEKKAMDKAALMNKEVFEKIGNKSLLSRLVEIGVFNGREKTNLESVYSAPFTDAVKIISIDNSK